MPVVKSFRGLALSASLAAALWPVPARPQTADPTAAAPATPPRVAESIEVTATRVPEDVETVPASITIVTGEEIAARGATDLPSALALAAGLSVAPGGDAGPAGSVPEIWGLREFDAFLLVVDGVPWGGAFNPATPSLDLTDVDRIEILRGSAPVMYGATSFVGVIHVLHRRPGAPGRTVRLSAGSFGSGSAALTAALPALGAFQQSLAVDGEKQGYKDDRTRFERGHLLYRAARETAAGTFHLDVDGTALRQDPASPHPRVGTALSPLVPLDANHNPSDAHVDENRFHVVVGYDRRLATGAWTTTLAVTRTRRDTVRGFLTDVSTADPNATGFEQDLTLTDAYFDTHLALHPRRDLQLVIGLDHLYGKANGNAQDFDYFVPLDGSHAPSSSTLTRQEGFDVEDERNFSGLYLQAEWTPAPRWRCQLGVRLNRTVEDREAAAESLTGGEEPGAEEEGGSDRRTVTRASGVLGVSFLAWQREADAVWAYADYRDTFKPAAIDFGPEAEPDILKPETARSYEVGLKGRHGEGRFDWEVSAFQMDFANLVVSQVVDDLPALVNAGKERFQGVELEVEARLAADLRWQAVYSYHDARFRDFLREFDGVPMQLRGNRLEMSPHDLAATGLVYAPARGWTGSVVYDWVGERFLNQRNTALAPAYSTWSAGVGYRFPGWELRLDGENLNDVRPPVSESELGDAQYYRLPARTLRLTWAARF
jgi:outer membrane receptor protein involved in Fe transport